MPWSAAGPELQVFIDTLGLEFLGFEFPGSLIGRYSDRFSDGPEGLSFSNWAIPEVESPLLIRCHISVSAAPVGMISPTRWRQGRDHYKINIDAAETPAGYNGDDNDH